MNVQKFNSLTAEAGLLMGWCLYHKADLTRTMTPSLPENDQFNDDLTRLVNQWKWKGFEPSNMTYSDYKARVMEALRDELKHNAWMSHNSTSLDSMMCRSRMGTEWADLVEMFMIVTPEEAAEIETLSGAGQMKRRALQARPKEFIPKGRQATWVG